MAAVIDGLVATPIAWLLFAFGHWLLRLSSETAVLGVVVSVVVVHYTYVVVLTAVTGKTAGKALIGIRVVRADTLGVPGFKRAAIRTLGLAPLGLLPYGNIAAGAAEASFLASSTRQGLHDLLAGTIVVDDREWTRWAAHTLTSRRPPVR